MLAKALIEGGDGAVDAADVAASIERALHDKYGSSANKDYKVTGRSLAQNLRRNASLRDRLLSEDLDADTLVGMGWQQLSTEEQRAADTATQASQMRKATLGEVDATNEGEHTCRECGSNAVRVLDAGRRDIGKGETWGSNNHDHEGRFLTCVKCNHRWEES